MAKISQTTRLHANTATVEEVTTNDINGLTVEELAALFGVVENIPNQLSSLKQKTASASENVSVIKTNIANAINGQYDTPVIASDTPISEYAARIQNIEKGITTQNTRTTPGYVLAGNGNPNRVWATDGNGNPRWDLNFFRMFGTYGEQVADPNTIALPGFYNVPAGNANSPFSFWCTIVCSRGHNDNWIQQLALPWSDAEPQIAYRLKCEKSGAGTWSAWKYISTVVNTRTLAGYVPAGGSNACKAWMTDVNGNPAWRDVGVFADFTGSTILEYYINHKYAPGCFVVSPVFPTDAPIQAEGFIEFRRDAGGARVVCIYNTYSHGTKASYYRSIFNNTWLINTWVKFSSAEEISELQTKIADLQTKFASFESAKSKIASSALGKQLGLAQATLDTIATKIEGYNPLVERTKVIYNWLVANCSNVAIIPVLAIRGVSGERDTFKFKIKTMPSSYTLVGGGSTVHREYDCAYKTDSANSSYDLPTSCQEYGAARGADRFSDVKFYLAVRHDTDNAKYAGMRIEYTTQGTPDVFVVGTFATIAYQSGGTTYTSSRPYNFLILSI